jgi:hypothetical protein
MSGKRFAHSSQAGGPAKAQDALTKAYLRVFSGQDGEMVLADLTAATGYYRRPSYGEWLAKTKTPNGFEATQRAEQRPRRSGAAHYGVPDAGRGAAGGAGEGGAAGGEVRRWSLPVAEIQIDPHGTFLRIQGRAAIEDPLRGGVHFFGVQRVRAVGNDRDILDVASIIERQFERSFQLAVHPRDRKDHASLNLLGQAFVFIGTRRDGAHGQ